MLILALAQAHEFYQAASFSVYDRSRRGPIIPPTLEFAPYVLMSRNHSNPRWAKRAARRLKNVIVFMDWVPDTSHLGDDDREEMRPMSAEQDEALREAFATLDVDDSQMLEAPEVELLLRAAGIDEDVHSVMSRADTDGNGSLDLQELRTALSSQRLWRTERGRWTVALSLVEAESLRALVHAAEGGPLFSASPVQPSSAAGKAGETSGCTALALRVASDNALSDASHAYSTPPDDHAQSSGACLRFVNSETDFEPRAINALLRQLQSQPAAARLAWWSRVRACRRRPRRAVQGTSLARLFTEVRLLLPLI